MNNTRKKIMAYRISTGLFALLLLLDGIGGVTRSELGAEVLLHLGYPLYLLPLLGTLKILAAIAIVQNRFVVLKEWAYAGFAFSCIGAFSSRLAVGDSGMDLAFPWIFLLIAAVPYWLWKRTSSHGHQGGINNLNGSHLAMEGV